MNATATMPRYAGVGNPAHVRHETSEPRPVASVVSRVDGAAGMIAEARSRIETLRNRVSTIAGQLHGPRPEKAQSNEPPPGNAGCSMSSLEECTKALHNEISALDEAISAL